ncbi:hypothetical protein [Arenimonas sp. GDDSR-1]|uniref:hypothetical protein n=1 Tax=Arenimonas sp. GDDSR-1 TaxID=2950125 RepID=UPI0026068F83|nr:hypothetical protein [Arenimonas sp. GDDSR-1]
MNRILPASIALALLLYASAEAAPTAAEPAAVNITQGRFYYKVGAAKATVLIVYVTDDFYGLYIWEKEALLSPVFEEHHAKNPALSTIAVRDAKTGKTVGTFAPKAGLNLL